MKNLFARVIILAAAAVAFGLQAQAQNAPQYRANVPFDFTAAGKTYTAGNYAVGRLSQVSEGGAIVLIDRKTGNSRIIGRTGGASPGNTAQLVFLKSGQHYALKEVSTPTFSVKMKRSSWAIAQAAESRQIIQLALK